MRTTRGIALGLLLLTGVAGCGSSSGTGVATANGTAAPSASTTLSNQQRLLKYAQCMRDHGVPVDDPTGNQPPTVPQGTVPDSTLNAAINACKHFVPTASQALTSADLVKLRKISVCMRQHGYPTFPDPDPDKGGIIIDDNSGIDTQSNAFQATAQACGMGGKKPPASSGSVG